MALAIYRKYRPKVFADLFGQAHVVEVLQNAARRGRIAHAYLFSGPRGSGKTTAARILAKIANCETRANDPKFLEKGEPCNRCRPCSEIDAGHGLDVVEIDAASNRGIDEIRDLKEGIRLSPSSYRFKVFIIDETHQLTTYAFNALLKILEEPPSHAIFILATTELEKVPPTIISRSQRFNFKKISVQEILKKLRNIVSEEKMSAKGGPASGWQVTDEALEMIAALAEGSFRDAESLLDQLTSLEDEVDVTVVERILGKASFAHTARLAGLILAGDLKASLDFLSEITGGGHNPVDLTKELIHYLRRAMSLKFDPNLEALFKNELTERELSELKKHSAMINASKHIPLLKALIRAWSEMRYSPFASIPLEVALIEHLGQGADLTK